MDDVARAELPSSSPFRASARPRASRGRQARGTMVPGAVTAPRPGRPVLQAELGARTDPEARALARAQDLLNRENRPALAAAIFKG